MFKIVFFVSICILIILAIIATVFAVKNSKDARSCSKSLNVANSQVDSCNSFCGAKGAWTVGQVSQIGGLIVNVLKTQTVVSCGNPSVSYPLLSSCVADKVSKSNRRLKNTPNVLFPPVGSDSINLFPQVQFPVKMSG